MTYERTQAIRLPRTSYLERLPSNDPGPEELTLLHDDSYVVVHEQLAAGKLRYLQKVARKRRKLLKWALTRIPKEEREAVRLSMAGKSQAEIAAIQGLSQMGVCQRLARAQARLQWLCTVGYRLDSGRLWRATEGLMHKRDRRLLVAWWETGSQSEAARRVLGDVKHQKLARSSVLIAKNVLKEIPRFEPISKCLESLWENNRLFDVGNRWETQTERLVLFLPIMGKVPKTAIVPLDTVIQPSMLPSDLVVRRCMVMLIERRWTVGHSHHVVAKECDITPRAAYEAYRTALRYVRLMQDANATREQLLIRAREIADQDQPDRLPAMTLIAKMTGALEPPKDQARTSAERVEYLRECLREPDDELLEALLAEREAVLNALALPAEGKEG